MQGWNWNLQILRHSHQGRERQVLLSRKGSASKLAFPAKAGKQDSMSNSAFFSFPWVKCSIVKQDWNSGILKYWSTGVLEYWNNKQIFSSFFLNSRLYLVLDGPLRTTHNLESGKTGAEYYFSILVTHYSSIPVFQYFTVPVIVFFSAKIPVSFNNTGQISL